MAIIPFSLRSGKNWKITYFAKNFARLAVPKFFFKSRLASILAKIDTREDRDYINSRVDYYCKLSSPVALPAEAPALSQHRLNHKKVYFFDTYEFTRWFKPDLHWSFLPGDITFIPPVPSIVKSRPILGDNANSVLFKLNKIRHFIFLKDRRPFIHKQPRVIFRGKVAGKQQRILFMEKFFGHPMVDAGDIGRHAFPQWRKEKKTLYDHLDFRYIMALEGNDVASNLKWIMSSNSIAVMPRPTFETWFMEGTLRPDVHYIEIKPDFSDLLQKIEYYNNHPEQAQKIIDNANLYVRQFMDNKREKLISLAVLRKYFLMTGQAPL